MEAVSLPKPLSVGPPSLPPPPAPATSSPPPPRPDEQVGFRNLLTPPGLPVLLREPGNAHRPSHPAARGMERFGPGDRAPRLHPSVGGAVRGPPPFSVYLGGGLWEGGEVHF